MPNKIPEKILVTGGSGFIGTHLCRVLLKAGYEVRVLDLVIPAKPFEDVRYIQGDVRDMATVSAAVRDVCAVFHFAARVSVPVCRDEPVESYHTNVLGTARIAEAIRHESLRQDRKVRLIFSSSASVYGNLGREGFPLSEEGPTAQPLSLYAAQKLASEQMLRLFHQDYGLAALVFRFFNVYGPGQDPQSPYSGVISVFSSALRDAKPLRLNGGGSQTRDFVSVYDIVTGCIRALEVHEKQCDARPINIGFGRSVSIRTLAEEMIQLSKKEVPLEISLPWPGDVLHSLADIRCAQKILNWNPQFHLSEGLAELL